MPTAGAAAASASGPFLLPARWGALVPTSSSSSSSSSAAGALPQPPRAEVVMSPRSTRPAQSTANAAEKEGLTTSPGKVCPRFLLILLLMPNMQANVMRAEANCTSMKKEEAQAMSRKLLFTITPAERKAAMTPAVRPVDRQTMLQACAVSSRLQYVESPVQGACEGGGRGGGERRRGEGGR